MNFPLIYLLNDNYETVATFSNELPNALPVISDFYEGSLDDNSFVVEIKTVLTHPRASEIKVGNYIYYPTNDTGDKKLFRIVEIKEERNSSQTITLVAELTVIGDLLEQVVRPTTFESGEIKEIAKGFLTNTQWDIEIRDVFPSIDYEVGDYTTVLEAIRNLAETIGAEIDYVYEYNGMTIVSRKVVFYKEEVKDISLYISRERDLQSIVRTIDNRDCITSLIAIGGTTKNGERVTLAQLGESTTIPPGYIHNYGSDYIESAIGIALSPTKRFGILNDSNCLTPQALLEKSVEKLKELAEPTVKYEVNFSILDKIGKLALGRHVFINDTTINPAIALSATIRQIKTSIYNPQDNAIVLGNYITYDTEINSAIKDMQDKIEQEEIKNNMNSYSMKIDSTNGTSFVNRQGETTLTIRVFKRGRELDNEGTYFDYVWRRYSESGGQIPINGVSGTMEIKQKSLKILGSNFSDTNKINIKGTVVITVE